MLGPLWFDDEKRYKTTYADQGGRGDSCGLMMKRDTRQRNIHKSYLRMSCGLMMKRDIRQLTDEHLTGHLVVV